MAAFDQGGGCPCGLHKECIPGCNYKNHATPLILQEHFRVNSITQKPSLGVKLSATIDELESAKIKSLADKSTADLEKIRKERAALEVLRDETIKQLTDSIESGKVPRIIVKSYEKRQWIRSAVKGDAPHQAVWENLKSWARTNALVIRVIEEHDGGGMESWISITVDPVRPGTRGGI